LVKILCNNRKCCIIILTCRNALPVLITCEIFISAVDANHTCYWSAVASVHSDKCSVMATFTPAPVDFGFSMYNVFLISGPDLVQRLTINTTDDVSQISSTHLLLLLLLLFTCCISITSGVSNRCNIYTSIPKRRCGCLCLLQ